MHEGGSNPAGFYYDSTVRNSFKYILRNFFRFTPQILQKLFETSVVQIVIHSQFQRVDFLRLFSSRIFDYFYKLSQKFNQNFAKVRFSDISATFSSKKSSTFSLLEPSFTVLFLSFISFISHHSKNLKRLRKLKLQLLKHILGFEFKVQGLVTRTKFLQDFFQQNCKKIYCLILSFQK